MEFITSTAPVGSSKKTGMFAPTNYKSIERKLVLDVRFLTWARLHPKNQVVLQQKQKDGEHHKKKLTHWHTTKHRKVIPVSHIINVSAVPPLKGAVMHLEITDMEPSKAATPQNNNVTQDNWHEAVSVENVFLYQHELVPTVIQSDVLAKAAVGNTIKNAAPVKKTKHLHQTMEEHTFQSPTQAANFQFTLLALKTVGSHINNMYTALELLHIASPDYPGQDTLLLNTMTTDTISTPDTNKKEQQQPQNTDNQNNEQPKNTELNNNTSTNNNNNRTPTTAGIAYDDVLRALADMPSLAPYIHRIRTDILSKSSKKEQQTTQQDQSLITSAADRSSSDDKQQTNDGGDNQNTNKDSDLYINKRLILGYVDFFRIFVPPLPKSALPYATPNASRGSGNEQHNGIDVHRKRILQLVKLRKRVAQASLRVRSYVRAMTIVRTGWHIPPPVTIDTPTTTEDENGQDKKEEQKETATAAAPTEILTQRLAFDQTQQNTLHNVTSKNQYYEPIVGKDVHCRQQQQQQQQSKQQQQQQQNPQAFALVACHFFETLDPSQEHTLDDHQNETNTDTTSSSSYALRPDIDPVLAIPSLRKIIQENPTMEFFVMTYFKRRPHKHALVSLFVRTLPTGVDANFDNTLQQFYNGSQAVRDQQLQLFIQLGPGSTLSPLSWAALNFLGLYVKIMKKSTQQSFTTMKRSIDGTTAFPAMVLSKYTTTRHFGKSLLPKNNALSDAPLPHNYIACTANIDREAVIKSVPLRFLVKRLELNALPTSIVDFTFVIDDGGANKQDIENTKVTTSNDGDKVTQQPPPLRALATKRMVHIDPNSVKYPISYGCVQQIEQIRQYLDNMSNDASIQSVVIGRGSLASSAHTTQEQQQQEENPSWFNFYSSTIQQSIINPIIGSTDSIRSFSNFLAGSITGGADGTHADQPRDGIHDGEEKKEDNGDNEEEEQERSEIDALIEILDGITVPVRRLNQDLIDGMPGAIMPLSPSSSLSVPTSTTTASTNNSSNDKSNNKIRTTATTTIISRDDMANVPILRNLTKHDLRRFYIASDGDLKTAAVRIVQSAAWRGITFPVDTRVCRIELQSGQFFQQGVDKENNPVFYFRNMCLGPWRKDIDATTFAVLHRLESAVVRWSKINPEVRCTVIVVMGSPLDEIWFDDDYDGDEGAADGEGGGDETATAATSATEGSSGSGGKKKKKRKKSKGLTQKQRNPFFVGTNPRIDPEEEYQVHTNFALVQRLHEVISRHYPERLSKLLVVSSKYGGWMKVFQNLGLKAQIHAKRTKDRITRIDSVVDLKKYVDESELVTFVGGKALVNPEAFEI